MKILLKAFVTLFVITSLLSCSSHDDQTAFYSDSNGQVRLEGIVLNIPAHSNLELALFALDNNNRPEKLIASEHFKNVTNTVIFQIKFDMAKAKPFSALELRGRVTQSGKLVGYLTPWRKTQLTQQDLKSIILELVNTKA